MASSAGGGRWRGLRGEELSARRKGGRGVYEVGEGER